MLDPILDPIRPAFTTKASMRAAVVLPSLMAAVLCALSACSGTTSTVATRLDSEDGGPPNSENGADGEAPAAPQLDGGGAVPVSTPGGDTDDCNQVEINFESKVPAVFILVDRSSSMFERGLWEPLKRGVLSIVEQLDKDVRFGFSSYTGQAGGTCPDLTSTVMVKDDNFAAIKSAYDAISAPTYKGETPTSRSIDEVAKVLSQEAANTAKFILLVTDGEPDFCDDPNVTCSRDAVVASVQRAKSQNIGTFIFSVGGSVDRAHLQDVANAGVGQSVEDRQMAVFYQCNGGTGSYGAPSGSAPFYEPNVNDQQQLVGALSGVVAGVRSCVFDLQGKLQIDLNAAGMGIVEIDGKRIPYGGADGFRMNSPTQLELLGNACATLRKPESKNVFIDFPCEAVVLL
jgi:uncharacterized protein YegL